MKFAVRDWTYRAIDAYAHRASGGGGIAIAPLEEQKVGEGGGGVVLRSSFVSDGGVCVVVVLGWCGLLAIAIAPLVEQEQQKEVYEGVCGVGYGWG